MVYLLLLFVLPISDLDSPQFAVRREARSKILATATLQQLSTELKKRHPLETRLSLQRCYTVIQHRLEAEQLENLKINQPCTLEGWKQFSKLAGNNWQTRSAYRYLWQKHRDAILGFFAEEHRAPYLLELSADWEPWQRPVLLFAFLANYTDAAPVNAWLLNQEKHSYCECTYCSQRFEAYSEITCRLIKAVETSRQGSPKWATATK